MTNREVMQQALDALLGYKPNSLTHAKEQGSAIIALREAIAQPEQPAVAAQAGQSEPVAWLANYINKSGLRCVYTTSSKSLAIENDAKGDPQPLYTHPAPVRQPLTEAQIDTICQRHWAAVRASPMETHRAFANPIDAYRAFARALEAKINAQGGAE